MSKFQSDPIGSLNACVTQAKRLPSDTLIAKVQQIRLAVADHSKDCVCDDCIHLLAYETVMARSINQAPTTETR